MTKRKAFLILLLSSSSLGLCLLGALVAFAVTDLKPSDLQICLGAVAGFIVWLLLDPLYFVDLEAELKRQEGRTHIAWTLYHMAVHAKTRNEKHLRKVIRELKSELEEAQGEDPEEEEESRA